MTDYLKCTLSVQLKVALAEQQHAAQIQPAIDMWTAAQYQVNQALASIDQLQTDLNGSWHDVAATDLAHDLDTGRKTLQAWSDNISTKPGVLTGLQDLVGGNGGPNMFQAVAVDAINAKEQFNKDYPNNHLPLEETPPSDALGRSLNALAVKYNDVTQYMVKAVSGGDWVSPRNTSGQPDTGDGHRTYTGSNVSKLGGSGTGDPAATTRPTDTQPTDTQDPVKDALAAAPNALDSLSGAAQSLQQLLGGSTSDLPSSTDGFNPVDLASMSPTGGDVSGGSGLPTLAGLDSGAAGFGGGAAGLGGGAAGFGSGIGSLPSGLNSVSAAGANISAPLAGSSAAAAQAATGNRMMPPMYPQRTAGAKGSGGVKPGAAEDVGFARAKGKPRGTPGVPLRGRAGKTEPRKGSRAQPSSPAPQRQRDPERVIAGLLDEELWQLNPEENEPRYHAGN